MDTMRLALMGMALVVTLAGCASVGNPVAPGPHASGAFETKLLNLFSVGTQSAGQTNYIPNTQLNSANQAITTNVAAQFPIASLVGTGAALATNLTGQTLFNTTVQHQNQNQLVL
jgi:hypothetical protein